MGQARRRGTKEERVAEAVARGYKIVTMDAPAAVLPRTPEEAAQLQSRMHRLFDGLTTPTGLNDQVIQFARMLSAADPVFLECRPEPWSRQDCCDLNVAKYVEIHGGRMICGYRVWYNEPVYIEGERHAVWTNGEELRDVSFSVSGEMNTLFVPDEKDFESAPRKVRLAFNKSDRDAVAVQVMIENANEPAIRSSELAWDQMLTYERWLDTRAKSKMPL